MLTPQKQRRVRVDGSGVPAPYAAFQTVPLCHRTGGIGFSSLLAGAKALPSHPRGCLRRAVRNNRAVKVQSKCPSCGIWRDMASLNNSESAPPFHVKFLIFLHWLPFHWPCKNEPPRRPYLLPRQSHDCFPQMKVSWGAIRSLKGEGIQEVSERWLYNYTYLHKSWAEGFVLPVPGWNLTHWALGPTPAPPAENWLDK